VTLPAPLPEPQPTELVVEAIARLLDEGVLLVGHDRRLRFANPAARTLLGLSGAAIGGLVEEVLPDFRLSVMVRTCLATGEEVARELVDALQGSHIVARALPVDSGGPGRREVALVLRDESRLRRLETVRRDFVANISHELRTPIAAIQLLVETLQEGALGEPDVAGEFVNKIGLEVAHMAHMVSELLELSAIEAGRPSSRAEVVPVPDLLAAADRLRPLADERHLELRYAVDDPPPAVIGDPLALGQVIRNLVHNAIKFTSDGGVIEVTVSRADGAAAMVEVAVSDTGCGIPPEALARIFERFYKADKSRQRDGEGTGLGLAIARHTVEAHGGSIRVESEPGKGSTFYVLLPAAG